MEIQYLKINVKKLKRLEKQQKFGRKEAEEWAYRIGDLIKMSAAKDLKLHSNRVKLVEVTAS